MNTAKADGRGIISVVVLLLVLSFGLYLPTLFHGAFADDEIYLAYTNRLLRDLPWTELHRFLVEPANPWEFLPLRDFSYWLDFRIYGEEGLGFHTTNLIWYAASGLASFCLFREMILFGRPEWALKATILSLCGTLIFVLHPSHVEAVAWIASRKDLIAGTLGLFSLAALAKAIRQGWPWHGLLLSALLLFLACFSKASAMADVLFASVLIGAAWRTDKQTPRIRAICYFLMLWGVIAFTLIIHLRVGASSGIGIDNHPGQWLMVDRASRIFTTLIGMLLFPYPLRFYHDVYQIGEWHWLVTAIAVLLFIASLRAIIRHRSLWALGIVLAFSSLFVYLQFVPFTTWSLASERFIFLSVAGLALAAIDLMGHMARAKHVIALVLITAIPAATVVWSRVADWDDPQTLLSREYELQPKFHNAIRDRIVYSLLPGKRYVEAAALARGVPRDYASDALLALVSAEEALSRMIDTDAGAAIGEKTRMRENFCAAVSALRLAVVRAYGDIPHEPDVSYNNILRTLDKQLKFRFGQAKTMCIADGA